MAAVLTVANAIQCRVCCSSLVAQFQCYHRFVQQCQPNCNPSLLNFTFFNPGFQKRFQHQPNSQLIRPGNGNLAAHWLMAAPKFQQPQAMLSS
ncbi:hypothetical protein A2U01_0042936 [Trifolium medium]|uniref:Uncharacterized protein n=1 Tax=Trifolium medium TaxID=97028 RepID=A0A392QE28_9FABA|nr:hypothetical protein [Trifolium medium]